MCSCTVPATIINEYDLHLYFAPNLMDYGGDVVKEWLDCLGLVVNRNDQRKNRARKPVDRSSFYIHCRQHHADQLMEL